jgi:hypothetical protein
VTQHYVPPSDITLLDEPRWPSKTLKKIIMRDGLIVPILVTERDGQYTAGDNRQSERIMACAELGFETVLIETEWDPEDL